MKILLNILIFSFVLVAFSTSVHAAECGSCEECSAAISSGEKDIVLRNNLIRNASDSCIIIENSENITINCEYNLIIGNFTPWSSGILINGGKGHTVQNCVIGGFYYGIFINRSTSNQIMGSTIAVNLIGVGLLHANKTNLQKNNISTNLYGIVSGNNYNVEFRNNTACNNTNFDIYAWNTTGLGIENRCENALNWNDTGVVGCTHYCRECIVPVDDFRVFKNTKLCRGWYFIEDLGSTGVIIINISNITLDCNNAILLGNYNGAGVYDSGYNNVRIMNCNISNYLHGIYFMNADRANLTNNTVRYNAGRGIFFANSDSAYLKENKAIGNAEGITFSNSYTNLLYNNRACQNTEYDIFLAKASATGWENKCDKNDGYYDSGYSTCTYPCETYCYNCSDCEAKLNTSKYVVPANDIITSEGSCINIYGLSNKTFDCENHTIWGVPQEFGYGIQLQLSRNITIKNCNITGFSTGIVFYSSDYTTILNNVFHGLGYGVWLGDSSYNTFVDNKMLNNLYGISLAFSDSNVFSRNRACKNEIMDIMRWNGIGMNTDINNICNKRFNWNNDGDVTWCSQTCTGNASTSCSNLTSCLASLEGDYGFVNITDDIYGGLDIDSSHVTLNCNSHRIIGNGSGSGISVISEVNNKIYNCEIYNFSTGIFLRDSSHCDVRYNYAHHNSYGAMLAKYSIVPARNNNIMDNNFTDNRNGLNLYDALANTVKKNNLLRSGDYSLYIEKECNNTITDNLGGIGIPLRFVHHTTSDTSGVYPEIIYCNASGKIIATISNNATRKEDGILIINSDNVRIDKSSITNSNGIQVINSRFVSIINSTVQYSELSGISLTSSNNATIENNSITNNADDGIKTYLSHRAKIIKNKILSNNRGIFLEHSNSTEIINSTIQNNHGKGIELVSSGRNIIRKNEFRNNTQYGIYIDQESNENQLYKNRICWHPSDIVNRGNLNTGDNNRCNNVYRWDDIGTTKCTMQCVGWYPYNYGLGYGNLDRDDLTYGWPWEGWDGHYVDVFGLDQTYITIWICIGLPVCIPFSGCYCAGYELEIPTIPEPLAVILYFAAFRDLAEPGHCVGMSGKSLDFYYGYNVPEDYQYVSKPKDLTHTGTFQRAVENMHGTQMTAEVINHILYHVLDEPNDVLSQARSALSVGNRGIFLVKKSTTVGHAIVTDTIDDFGDISRIYVYDPNREDTAWHIYENESWYPYITINRVSNDFEFYMAGGDRWTHMIYYLPHSILKGPRTLPSTPDGILEMLFGASTGMVVDENGNRLGYDEFGNSYEEIPNATGVPILGNLSKNIGIYILGNLSNYDIDIFGNETGNYSNYMFHRNIMYGVDDVSANPSTRDKMGLILKDNNPMDGVINFSTNENKKFSSRIIKQFRNKRADRIYRIVDSDLYSGENVMIRTTPDFHALIFTNRGSHNLNYAVEFGSTMMEPGEEGSENYENLQARGFTISSMTTHMIYPESWYNLNKQDIHVLSFVCGNSICSGEAEDYINCPEDCEKPSCEKPFDNMYIDKNTTLCYGNYTIKDSGYPGVIIINKDGVELDCNGAILNGNGTGIGIKLNGRDNVTLHNCRLFGYHDGIYLTENSNYNIIFHNVLRSNTNGIKISYSLSNVIYENMVIFNIYGIVLDRSQKSQMNRNYLCNNMELDISHTGIFNSNGVDNVCNKPNGWNDTAAIGCTYLCRYPDSDKDGIPDKFDNCPDVFNPRQEISACMSLENLIISEAGYSTQVSGFSLIFTIIQQPVKLTTIDTYQLFLGWTELLTAQLST